MKFSFTLIKKFAPGDYDKTALVNALNTHTFETVDEGGDILEIGVSANRFSDGASHRGIAQEVAAIFKTPFEDPISLKMKYDGENSGVFRVHNKEPKLCRRYCAAYATDVRVGSSPKWMQDILETCGLRPINSVVDVMNYVMLELGQPLHVFDADTVKGGLVVRRANKKEHIETIDSQKFTLDHDMLVIADAEKALAIAGIKGGKTSEVTLHTKHILVESANFDGVSIYKTSRALGLRTDASTRFSHHISPELAWLGIERALQLLQGITGAKVYEPIDEYTKKQSRKTLVFSMKKIQKITGITLKEKEALDLLAPLGFIKKEKVLEIPVLRTDIENIEDIAEEIVRLNGLDALPAEPPSVALGVAHEDEIVLLKDRIRQMLVNGGFSEVYNYSLVSLGDTKTAPALHGDIVELANPMSKQLAVLRDSLAPGLLKNIKENTRFFDEVRIFEIGNIFAQSTEIHESPFLGIAVYSKHAVLELKGIADIVLQKLGITDYFLPALEESYPLLKPHEVLRIVTSDQEVLGYLGTVQGTKSAVLEMNLQKLLKSVDEEKEYEPLSRFPSIMRDISLLVNNALRVGEILTIIQQVSSKLVEDVDLVDWYQDKKLGDNKKSLTFRIVFRAEDRTLTDAEVDKEVAIINQVLIDKFNVELR
ncbi:MAG: phenylalanine--tRNA ligase subunit beta [bacterium]|nr:phenylalanine--tRNA ligase subunit beta [bacterium]